jgi:UDP-N-acetylglucosamine 2-epimerase (non-hydrolysing)
MAPVVNELNQRGIPQLFVHTGQHYDEKMSTIFFEELGMPKPDIYLGVGSGSHAVQTARVMEAFEQVCGKYPFDLVIVAGDVNSTLACALTSAKLHIPVAHVEAGLRSFDRKMPEEINRVLTDHIADLLFVTERSGEDNLRKEGLDRSKIHFVGNTMIDSLQAHREKALDKRPWNKFDLAPKEYVIVTLHRPANVDNPSVLTGICEALEIISQEIPVIFPIHPRTWKQIDNAKIQLHNVILAEPLGYLSFLGLMAMAKCVLTDSGGIQEETTALGVPCITIRENTERPVTLEIGTNLLAGIQKEGILDAFQKAITTDDNQKFPGVIYPGGTRRIPELWDGQAAQRVVDVIERWRNLGSP